MKFTPLKFQGTLAAAGVALMPYVFLKINIFKSEGTISLSELPILSGNTLEYAGALFLIAVMGLFIVIHFTLTAIFLKELFIWLLKHDNFKELMKNPLANSALFSPLISLPMSMVVFFGPVSFFVPQLTENMQSLMLPAFVVFSFLWVILILLELKVVKVFFTESVEHEKLNFGWLLDVLALGAVSLFGSSIADFSKSDLIASSVAFMVMIALLVGISVFVLKIAILFYQQIKSKVMPSINILPAYFLVVPPMCLLGFSFYKLLGYASKTYGFDTNAVSFLIIVFSYLTAMSWFIFSIVLLREYLKKEFLSSDFSPAQWGMV
jgi:tellurite resistance protein TehA-like permease